jgi:hypothetical protein
MTFFLKTLFSTYFSFFVYSSLIIAHPFYKTMPKEVEHIYDELKALEQEAIDAFKKAYPKVPVYWWKDVTFFSTQTQVWLTGTASSDNSPEIQEPTIGKNWTEEEMAEYCKHYIEYECIKQNINFNKVKIQSVAFA